VGIRLLEFGIKMPLYTLEEIIENDIWVIINPNAGKRSKQVEKDLRQILGMDHINYYLSNSKQDITQMVSWLADKAEKRQSTIMVLVVGGDGTYSDAINASGNLKRLIFGFSDGGTSSDFARSLNTKTRHRTGNLVNALRENEAALEEHVKPIDLIRVNYKEDNQQKELRALNLFSTGFDGEVCKIVNESVETGGIKKKAGFVSVAKKVLKHYNPLDIEYILNDDLTKKTALDVLTFVLINGRYAGSGINYNPYFDVSDGYIEGMIAKKRGTLDMLNMAFHMKVLQDNRHIDLPPIKDGYNRLGVRYEDKINSITLQVTNAGEKKEGYFETDGEHQRYNPQHPVKIEVLPQATNALYVP
jgi:diacylglycerol kinase family enzyme